MKIAVICDHIPSIWAHSINAMKHAQGFFKLGHNVEVLILRHLFEENKLKIKSVHNFYAINDKIKLKYFPDYYPYHFKKIRFLTPLLNKPANAKINYFPNLFSFLDVEKNISNFCKKKKIDFVYCRRTERTAFYNVLNKIPIVIETHNFKNIILPNLDMKLLLMLSKNKYFKGIVTIHEYLKKLFIKQGVPKEKIIVLEDGVDLDNFERIKNNKLELRQELGLPLYKNIVMYCGSLKAGKGIETILETAKKTNNRALFYLIGGTYKSNKFWKKKAEKKNVKNIRFLGFKESALIPKYLKSADILFMPYDLNEKNEIMNINTTSPLKLFEYMAAKKPIISSKIPTIEKIIRHEEEALLAYPSKINEIVEFIEILLKNERLAEQLANSARNKVKNYNIERRCEIILEKLGN